MEPFRLFFGHSFAREAPHSPGLSDWDLAEIIVRWIGEFAGERIQVVRTRDPYRGYISSEVRRDIYSSDGVLCLFTKRTEDHLTRRWLPSIYVTNEAAAAFMQFPEEREPPRLFGFVEEGVDRAQLGMGFHGDQTAPGFRRADLEDLKAHVKRMVDAILRDDVVGMLRPDCEYLSVEKVVSVWRNGAVRVATRHRFRFTKEMTSVRIPHTIWRVSSKLPSVRNLMNAPSDSSTGFIRVLPILCGHHDHDKCACNIVPGAPTLSEYEHNFHVEFKNVRVVPGEELGYEIMWGYQGAFHNRPIELPDKTPNAVGLRMSGRGTAQVAGLTLEFERDLSGEPFRILEAPPEIYTTKETALPSPYTPEQFFHHPDFWQPITTMRRCAKRSSNLWEVYRWTTSRFQGMAKATWTPHLNYFTCPPLPSSTSADAPNAATTKAGEQPLSPKG